MSVLEGVGFLVVVFVAFILGAATLTATGVGCVKLYLWCRIGYHAELAGVSFRKKTEPPPHDASKFSAEQLGTVRAIMALWSESAIPPERAYVELSNALEGRHVDIRQDSIGRVD